MLRKGFGRPVLVFPSEENTYLPFSSLRRVMRRYAELAGVKQISIHAMRHTCATMLINKGVPLPVVAQRLGHSDPSVTLKVYAHVLPTLQRDAALLVDLATPT